METNQIISELVSVGVTEHDALVIADCIISRQSCSWLNTDPVDEKLLQDLKLLVDKKNYKINVKVQSIPTRGKYIWDVKVL